MTNKHSSREPELAQQYWLAQSTEAFRLGPGDLARQIKRLESGARNANVQMYVASFFILGMWLTVALLPLGLVARAGACLAALGWTFGLFQLARERRRTIAVCLAMAERPIAAFYRAALERERSLFLGPKFWIRYGAIIVGPLVFGIGAGLHDRAAIIPGVIVGGLFTAINSLSIHLRHRQAGGFQRQIDSIHLYTEDQP
jgi:hypothetical protein